ncbi:MAG: hypothetical protein KF797_03495, partial [Flavobacteriales bacterium]|nr:hypothetical protein [Flavobacteriales bacterium]
ISGSPYFDASTIYRNQNPAFVDVPGRNLHIGENSFARGRAHPTFILPQFSPWDMDNAQRPNRYGEWDLGCYQYAD